MNASARRLSLALAVVASLLPVAGAAVPGATYYFRDFTVTFYPQRWLFATELAAGRWPAWNPFVQEGTFLLPALYPVDLLHVLGPSPAWVSWLLTLHFPLAAVAAHALARHLGLRPGGAALAAGLYATAGLCASSLNLYVFLQAYALAPLVALTLARAAERGGRAMGLAALVLAGSISTLAVEFVGQAILLGLALGLARGGSAVRAGLSILLGVSLAGVPVALLAGLLGETARGGGFPADVALGHAVHPFALVQMLVPHLFGSLSAPAETWWGQAFFSRGFPYFLSLHLGPLALGLAVAGAALPGPGRRTLLGLGSLGLLYALGPWGGLAPLVQGLPGASLFRFPGKAMLLPTVSLVLLAGRGLDAVSAGATRVLGWTCATLAGLTCLVAVAFQRFPELALRLAGGDPAASGRAQAWVPAACALPLVLALLGALLALATGRWTPARRSAQLLGALALVDTVQAASGMNPQVPARYFELLPEISALRLQGLGGGRVFTYGIDHSPALRAFLGTRPPGAALWSFFASRQMLAPYTNVLDGVELAEAKDLTSLVPNPPELRPEDYDPARVGTILDYLRNQAVTRLLSLDPLRHPDLRDLAAVPTGAPGLTLHAYELLRPWPRASLACRAHVASRDGALGLPFDPRFDPLLDVALDPGAPPASCSSGSARVLRLGLRDEEHEVESDGPGYLVVRAAMARGWSASVDGSPTRVYRANGRHRAVPVPPGRHHVRLHYDPPGLWAGLGLLAGGLAGTALLLGRRGKMPGP